MKRLDFTMIFGLVNDERILRERLRGSVSARKFYLRAKVAPENLF